MTLFLPYLKNTLCVFFLHVGKMVCVCRGWGGAWSNKKGRRMLRAEGIVENSGNPSRSRGSWAWPPADSFYLLMTAHLWWANV